jgi:hypothetical protein
VKRAVGFSSRHKEENMKTHTFFCLSCVAGSLILLFSACQPGSPTPNATDIRVERTLPTRAIIDTEEIPIPNCAGNIDIVQTLGSLKSIETTSEVNATATATDGSEQKLPEGLKLKLEIEVTKSYEQTYQNAVSRLENVSMDAAGNFETVYVIQWEQLSYHGNVYYSDRDRVYQVRYLYQLKVPKRLSKEEKACDENMATVTLSPQGTEGAAATAEFTALAPTQYILKLRTNAFLYKGPQMEYGALDLKRRKEGEEFSIVARNSQGDWFLVQEEDGTQGWFYTEWVDMTFDPELIPVTTDFPPPPSSPPTPTSRPKPPPSYP